MSYHVVMAPLLVQRWGLGCKGAGPELQLAFRAALLASIALFPVFPPWHLPLFVWGHTSRPQGSAYSPLFSSLSANPRAPPPTPMLCQWDSMHTLNVCRRDRARGPPPACQGAVEGMGGWDGNWAILRCVAGAQRLPSYPLRA